MNKGSFRKGEKRPRQGKHGPQKHTLEVKKILALAVEQQFEHIGPALNKIRSKSPALFIKSLTSLMEYVVPKQARVEHSGEVLHSVVLTIEEFDDIAASVFRSIGPAQPTTQPNEQTNSGG